ncbi:MAG: hypothetical protein KGJ13_12810 [Patescibacteria group bacterium]|nr:hypothetical protein [Patescibacteria group bacterium]
MTEQVFGAYAITEDVAANRPAVPSAPNGMLAIFKATDTGLMSVAIGGAWKDFVPAENAPFTAGSVLFQGTNGIKQDAPHFFYDAVNVRLGINTNTPLSITNANGNIIQLAGTSAVGAGLGGITPTANIEVFAGNASSFIYSSTNTPMHISTNGTHRITLTADGSIDMVTTSGACIVPRLTTAQKNSLTAQNGMIIYDTTLNRFQGFENGAWNNFSLL